MVKFFGKAQWEGVVQSVQPRIRLLRSFDERHHNYLGYALWVRGEMEHNDDSEFWIGIGKAAYAKHKFQISDQIKGVCQRIADEQKESVQFYKVSKLEIIQRSKLNVPSPPPFHGDLPTLDEYRQRGHRRLDTGTYNSKCQTCLWGCRMAVEMIVDHWNPANKRYRYETFCYGPKSCSIYQAGPKRKVPGRKDMSWTEEDWIDEEATSHRGPDD